MMEIEIHVFLTYFLYQICTLQYWPLLLLTVDIKILECNLFILPRHR
jgi:hypothetical protein